MILEYSDIAPFIPAIKEEFRQEIANAKEEFLSYPRGMQDFLYNEITPATYQKVYALWNKKDFPRVDRDSMRGVWLTELKAWSKNK